MITDIAATGGAATATAAAITGIAVAAEVAIDMNHCKKSVDVAKPLDDFSLDDFISQPWYSQKQNEQQYQRKDSMACTSASYFERKTGGCGYDVSNVGGVAGNYTYQSTSGKFDGNNTHGFLCASRVKNISNGLEVKPCFFCGNKTEKTEGMTPNYSVIHYDKTRGAAIVIGGQPNAVTREGKKCTFEIPLMNGMWIFTRQRKRDAVLVEELVKKMNETFNLDTSLLVDVDQTNCGRYDDVVKETLETHR